MTKPIQIVDYGLGNLASIVNMLRYLGYNSEIVSKPEEILSANKLILPGVGSFDTAIKKIINQNLLEPLNEKANSSKVPILGICLGMQLLLEKSDEGKKKGLGWIPGEVISFKNHREKNIRIPHMGWNILNSMKQNKLLNNFDQFPQARFYFVHSYYVKLQNEQHSIAKTNYGISFDSIINRDNIYGAQFHPEKSHKFGMQLLKNFAEI